MTPRELLLGVLAHTSTDYLDERFGMDEELRDIADYILSSCNEDILNKAADTYEREQAEQYPGAIYGAIRRIRAYKVGAWLRRMADEETSR
ncbi:hypothetical protein ACFY8X_38980 [Streptomyces tanashiensis]|uniref:hypothetical protein n=1 Tax=Streptomyces tanashiensis TaxID=67367 RepID=UPI0036EAA35C